MSTIETPQPLPMYEREHSAPLDMDAFLSKHGLNDMPHSAEVLRRWMAEEDPNNNQI